MTHHNGRILHRGHSGPPLIGAPTVFVLEDLPNILLQTAEVETRAGEIVIREVVDQMGPMRVTEIVLDPMRALMLGEEIVRQAMEAMGQ